MFCGRPRGGITASEKCLLKFRPGILIGKPLSFIFMSDPNEDLRAAVSELRSELDSVKQELRKLQRVVQIDEEDGMERVTVECNDVVIRPVEDPRFISMLIGCPGGTGEISILHPKGERHTAVVLGVNEGGEPELRLQGPDYEPRVQLTVQDDRGLVAVLGAGLQAGAVMQAQPGGGSVAVLEPDGTARGVLMHRTENADKDGKGDAVTELALLEPGGGRIKLRTDAAGAVMVAGTSAQPVAVALSAKEEIAAVMLKSAGATQGACMVAGPEAAQVSVFHGETPSSGCSASLASMADAADVRLNGPGGVKGAELETDGVHTGLTLWDKAGGESARLMYVEGSHGQFFLRGAAEHTAVEFLAMQNLSSFSLTSPTDPGVKLLSLVNERSVSTAHMKGVHPVVMLSETELGGTVSVRGLTDMGGQVTLGGGQAAGGLSLAAGDGTVMLSLDATDHGGRLLMNNDLGFQRILMGVYEESANLLLNHTGQQGVSVMATEGGGVVAVHDDEGRPRASLPPMRQEEEEVDGEEEE